MCRWGTAVSVMLVCATSGGCAVQSVLPSSGPSSDTVVSESRSEIEVVQVTGAIAADLALRRRRQLFSETLGSGEDIRYTIGRGDVLEVSVWEAPPALLFGGTGLDVRSTSASSRAAAFPEQMVSIDGTITIPFAGLDQSLASRSAASLAPVGAPTSSELLVGFV